MAREKTDSDNYVRPVRRILVGTLVAFLLALFMFWRIDSPRAEYLRARIIDNTVPRFDWVMAPVTKAAEMI